MRSAGSAFRHTFRAQPSAPQKPVARDRLVGVFGAGREMAAAMADKTRQCELVETDHAGTEKAAGRSAPRA